MRTEKQIEDETWNLAIDILLPHRGKDYVRSYVDGESIPNELIASVAKGLGSYAAELSREYSLERVSEVLGRIDNAMDESATDPDDQDGWEECNHQVTEEMEEIRKEENER